MTDQSNEPEKSASEKLADVLAKKKAAAGGPGGQLPGGRRGSERAAAHLSASKSKPAPRKG